MKRLLVLITFTLVLSNSFSSDTLTGRKELLYRCLDMEKEAGFDVKETDYLLLDSILEKASAKINISDTSAENYPKNILLQIHEVIEESGITGDYNQEDPYKSLLSYSLQTKKFDCDKYSFVFLAVAERLGLPIFGVMLPSHMAVEWKDSSKSMYWETTNKTARNKEDYIRQFSISKLQLENGMYLSRMTSEDLYLCFLYNRGLTFLMLGKFKEAQKDLSASKALKGIHPFIFFMELICINKIHIEKTSVRLLRNPDNDSARIERAKAYIHLRGKDHYAKAIEDLNFILNKNPEHVQARLWRGISHMHLFMLSNLSKGNKYFKNAMNDFNFVLSKDPENHECYLNKSILNRWARNYEEASSDIEKAISLRSSENAWIEKGNVYYNQKQFEKAVECYNKALEYNTDCYQAIQCRAFAKRELKNEDAAQDFFQAYYQGIMPYDQFKKYSIIPYKE